MKDIFKEAETNIINDISKIINKIIIKTVAIVVVICGALYLFLVNY